MKIKICSLIIVAMCMLNITGCESNNKTQQLTTNKEQITPLSKTEIFMGTVVNIKIYDKYDENIINKAFDKIEEIENLVSLNKEETEIQKLNDNAGIKPVKLSDETYYIIKEAYRYSKESSGGYDLTIGPLVKLWNIGTEQVKVPTKDEIQQVISKIDYNKIEMNDETKEVYLTQKGMKIDLGSIAKGYTADEVAKLLKQEGVKQAIIDIGGNIYAMGLKNNTEEWTIGIQDPFSDRGEIVGSVAVSDKSVVTSGIYERYMEKDGVKYHHILNPKTGYPYESDIAGVTIIADKSIDADALSTVVFTKGIEEGIEFIENQEGSQAIFISKDKKIYLTSGIKNNFEHTNNEFEIISK